MTHVPRWAARGWFLALIVSLTPGVAHAQDEGRVDPADSASVHWGPVALTPTVSFNRFGIDTNVFNDTNNPKRDVTAALTGGATVWVSLGVAQLTWQGSANALYFKDYSNQRSIDTSHTAELRFNLGWLRPYVGGSLLNTRERLNAEIDTRVPRIENAITVGTDFVLSPNLTLGVSARRSRVNFAQGATFEAIDVRQSLDRAEDGASTSLTYELTPLTRLALKTELQWDRFEFSSQRNSKTLRVTPGILFDEFALVSGSLFAGYRRLEPADPEVPVFTGPVAAVTLNTVAFGATQFAARASRDVAYSVDVRWPYFAQTALGGTITQRIADSWDASVSADQQWLAYRSTGSTLDPTPRTLMLSSYSAGISHRLASGVRFDFTTEYARRTSPRASDRDFQGLRVYTSISVGGRS